MHAPNRHCVRKCITASDPILSDNYLLSSILRPFYMIERHTLHIISAIGDGCVRHIHTQKPSSTYAYLLKLCVVFERKWYLRVCVSIIYDTGYFHYVQNLKDKTKQKSRSKKNTKITEDCTCLAVTIESMAHIV